MKWIPSLALASLLLAGCAVNMRVSLPPRHPAYLHALADLRAAKWNIEHRPGNFRVSEDEARAVGQIWAVIRDIKEAAYDDGKDVNDHPMADEALDYRGHLHRALDLLRRAHGDLAQPEDNPNAVGLRDRSVDHLDRAIRMTERTIAVAEGGVGGPP